MRLHNTVDEYLLHRQFTEVKETVADLADVHKLSKAISAGHMLLYAHGKKPEEFRLVSDLVLQMLKEGVLVSAELEEA